MRSNFLSAAPLLARMFARVVAAILSLLRRRSIRWWEGYGNALIETINGCYRAELIHRRVQRKRRETVELVALEWGGGLTSIGYWNPSATFQRPMLK